MPLQLLGPIASSVQKATTAFESIATVTASGSTTTVTFSSIPSTYQHLQIRGILYDANGYNTVVRFNSDSGSNYAHHRLQGDGSSASASGTSSTTGILAAVSSYSASAYYGATIIDILDYKSSSKNKTVRAFFGFDQNGAGICYLGSGLWMNTNAVTSISIVNTGGNFNSSTTFALYGIKGA